MSTESSFSSEESFAIEMHRLLESASHAPWGPGREIDEKVHTLHMQLLSVQSRLGGVDEQPDDPRLAHSLDHELRNKLMIYHYHDQQRRASTPPMPVKPRFQKKKLSAAR